MTGGVSIPNSMTMIVFWGMSAIALRKSGNDPKELMKVTGETANVASIVATNRKPTVTRIGENTKDTDGWACFVGVPLCHLFLRNDGWGLEFTLPVDDGVAMFLGVVVAGMGVCCLRRKDVVLNVKRVCVCVCVSKV